MYRGFNSTWEERLVDLHERSKIQRVMDYCNGKRTYTSKDHIEWANTSFLALNEAWMITNWLVDIERKIQKTTGISRSDALYYSRRFEYPWAFMRLPQRRGCKILDAGGGNATFQFLLSLLHGEVVNIDLNTEFLDEVNKIKLDTDSFINLKTMRGTFIKTEYPDNHFDACVCISALEHGKSEDIVKGIRELRRVTRGPVAITMDVSQFGAKDEECIDETAFNNMVYYDLGIDLIYNPDDVMTMQTVRNNPFKIACIYLHGEEL